MNSEANARALNRSLEGGLTGRQLELHFLGQHQGWRIAQSLG